MPNAPRPFPNPTAAAPRCHPGEDRGSRIEDRGSRIEDRFAILDSRSSIFDFHSKHLWGVLGVLVIAALFRLHALGRECFDCDELYAVRIQGPSWQALGAVLGRDTFHTNHPPLMTVPYFYWTALFGTSERAVRMLPALLGLVAVLLTYRLGYVLSGPLVGFLAALLLALNPLHIAYSREARSYAMLVAVLTAAHLLFVRCLRTGQARARAGYFLLCLTALFTHYFAVPALAAHGVIAAWLLLTGDRDSRHNAAGALLTLTLATVPFLAWLPIIPHQAKTPWVHLSEASWTNILACGTEVAGLGLGLALLPAALALLSLVALGLVSMRSFHLSPCATDARGPFPAWVAPVLGVGGLVGAGVLFLSVPSSVFPLAHRVLEANGYGSQAIAFELKMIHYFAVAFPLAALALGAGLAFWSRLLRLLDSVPQLGLRGRQPVSVAFVLGVLLVVPLLLVWVIGYLGIPFLQTRNLLVLTPPLCLLTALGLARLAQLRAGRLWAGFALGCLAFGVCQYDHVASVFGASGARLDMQTEPWHDLAGALADRYPQPLPLLTTKTPSTDPLLYYLADRHPRRLALVDGQLETGVPSTFVFVHLSNNLYSWQVHEHLRQVAHRMEEVLRVKTLVVYEIDW